MRCIFKMFKYDNLNLKLRISTKTGESAREGREVVWLQIKQKMNYDTSHPRHCFKRYGHAKGCWMNNY